MDRFMRNTLITMVTTTLFAAVTLALAMPMTTIMQKSGYHITWDSDIHTVTIEKKFDKEALSTDATVTAVGNGYVLAQTEKLGNICFMVDDNTVFSVGGLSDLCAGESIKIYFGEVLTTTSTPQSYAREVVIR
ncbi:MAG: hypothetical protein IJ435_00305 [Clostridia bacterium]|nr:hypothetical protein [Clostridia bacterium]